MNTHVSRTVIPPRIYYIVACYVVASVCCTRGDTWGHEAMALWKGNSRTMIIYAGAKVDRPDTTRRLLKRIPAIKRHDVFSVFLYRRYRLSE